jgi:hypothetical protein
MHRFGVRPRRRACLKNSPDLVSTPWFLPRATQDKRNVMSLGKNNFRERVKALAWFLLSSDNDGGINGKNFSRNDESWHEFSEHGLCQICRIGHDLTPYQEAA